MGYPTPPQLRVAGGSGGVERALRSVAHQALELLFPIACVGCERYVDADRWLCAVCRARIRPAWLTCCVCGVHTPTGRTCYGCLTETPLQGVIAVGLYADPVLRAAITQFKFRGVRALAQPLGELLARRIAAAGLTRTNPGEQATRSPRAPGLTSTAQGKREAGAGETAGFPPQLVPLPLHPRRERERGFNQARLLAEVIGAQLKLPVENLLIRTRATSPQTSIIESPRARRANITGAFALAVQPPRLNGATSEVGRVILIDDVLTTGATMREAASVLATAGAREIWAAVVARGSQHAGKR